jgi:2-(1,2-epoxy-1,2-dihydrophenyl)acetyl-CoA isomerase
MPACRNGAAVDVVDGVIHGVADGAADRLIETGTSTVEVVVRDRVGIITLNRPERRNALHREMYEPIKLALADFAEAADVGCVVLTGAGSGFCSGGDVRDGRPRNPDGSRPTTEERVASLLDDAAVCVMLHQHPKVTVAAVNGPAVGAGMSLALACDLRIASDTASFRGGWVRLAFSGDYGGSWFLTRLVGGAKALEILATNTLVDPGEALRLGLVNRVIRAVEFADEWFAVASGIAHGPQQAIAAMKRNVHDAMAMPLADALRLESERMVASTRTADHKAAVKAWLEGTEPVFGPG